MPFYDLTFSATKSVSLLQVSYAAAAAKARAAGHHDQAAEYERRVRAIDEAAVETARQLVGLAERRALFVRTGHHGKHSGEWRDADGAVAALFPQHDNRSGEPNLHVHIVLLNRAMRADHQTCGDRKWRALYGRPLWKEQLGLAAAGRADLRPAAGHAGHPDGPAGDRERVRGRRGRAGHHGRVLGPDAGADRPGAAGRGRGV